MRPQRVFACLLGGLTLLFLVSAPSPAPSQLIQIRPGYVRAPFVRVYYDGFGGSHVRAPFVSVSTPGFYPGPYVAPAANSAYPAPTAYAPVTAGSPTPTRSTGPATPRANRKQDLPPVERQRRDLRLAADALHQQLARLRVGSGWSDYLRIQLQNPESRVTESIVNGENRWPTSPESEREFLEETLRRFEKVLDTPEYQVIARLPAFQPAYEHLARYLELTHDTADDVELLPEPQSAGQATERTSPTQRATEDPAPEEPIPAEPTLDVPPLPLEATPTTPPLPLDPLPADEPTPADPLSD